MIQYSQNDLQGVKACPGSRHKPKSSELSCNFSANLKTRKQASQSPTNINLYLRMYVRMLEYTEGHKDPSPQFREAAHQSVWPNGPITSCTHLPLF